LSQFTTGKVSTSRKKSLPMNVTLLICITVLWWTSRYNLK